jgi:hypothetical protein
VKGEIFGVGPDAVFWGFSLLVSVAALLLLVHNVWCYLTGRDYYSDEGTVPMICLVALPGLNVVVLGLILVFAGIPTLWEEWAGKIFERIRERAMRRRGEKL